MFSFVLIYSSVLETRYILSAKGSGSSLWHDCIISNGKRTDTNPNMPVLLLMTFKYKTKILQIWLHRGGGLKV